MDADTTGGLIVLPIPYHDGYVPLGFTTTDGKQYVAGHLTPGYRLHFYAPRLVASPPSPSRAADAPTTTTQDEAAALEQQRRLHDEGNAMIGERMRHYFKFEPEPDDDATD
jgi:hypothetical protein